MSMNESQTPEPTSPGTTPERETLEQQRARLLTEIDKTYGGPPSRGSGRRPRRRIASRQPEGFDPHSSREEVIQHIVDTLLSPAGQNGVDLHDLFPRSADQIGAGLAELRAAEAIQASRLQGSDRIHVSATPKLKDGSVVVWFGQIADGTSEAPALLSSKVLYERIRDAVANKPGYDVSTPRLQNGAVHPKVQEAIGQLIEQGSVTVADPGQPAGTSLRVAATPQLNAETAAARNAVSKPAMKQPNRGLSL
jgi:hypothetical protein